MKPFFVPLDRTTGNRHTESPQITRGVTVAFAVPHTVKSAVFFVLPSAHLLGVEYILARRRPVSARTGGSGKPGSVVLPFLYPQSQITRGVPCPSPALPSLKAASCSLNRLFTGNRPTTNSFAASSCTCRNGSSPATMPHWLQCLPFPHRKGRNSEFAAQWSHGPARRLLSVMPDGWARPANETTTGPSRNGPENNLLTSRNFFMLFWGIRRHVHAPGNLKENRYAQSRSLCF